MQNHSDIILNKAILLILLVVILNVIILIIKISIYLMTMSIAAFAYLLDTIMDMQNDIISLFGLRKARTPPDKEHPYGHAKYDAFAATIIAVFIIAITLEMTIGTFTRIFEGVYQVSFDPSLIIIFSILMVIYSLIAIVQNRFAMKYGILTIESTALHYITDPLFTLLVFIGILLASMKFWWVDFLVSVIIILIVLKKAISIIKKTSRILLDAAVINEQELRESILHAFKGKVIDCEDICSRTDGTKVFLEMILKMNKNLSLEESDKIAHEVEEFIRKKYKHLKFEKIIIHQEPY